MNYKCYTCKKETKGWVKVSQYSCSEFNTYCSYDCYKMNPVIVPQGPVYKSLKENSAYPLIIPSINIEKENKFIFLSEEELNQLTNEEYYSYEVNLEEHCLLNSVKSDIYYTGIQYDKHEKYLEKYFNESQSMDDLKVDDY